VDEVIENKYQSVLELMSEKEAESMRNESYVLRDDMLSGKKGKRITKMDIEKQDIWYFYAPIPSAGWSAAIGVNENEAFAHIYNRAWYSIGFFSLLLFLLITFITLASGKFSRAFAWIISRCERIERMNFQPAGKVNFNIEEIHKLSNTLDNMSHALDAHFSVVEDVQIAQSVHEQSLPLSIPEISGYEIGIWSRTTENGYGEMYDVFELQQSGQVGFLLLNDADKGIQASVKNAQLRAIFRTAIMKNCSLEDLAKQMNGFLFSDSSLNGAVQVWMGLLEIEKGSFTSVSLGRNTVFYYSTMQNAVHKNEGNSKALSMQKELPGVTEQVFDLLPGDVLAISSEGVTSALNNKREAFGVANIENILQQQSTENAEDILGACKQTFLDFTKDAYVQTEGTIIIIKRIDNNTSQLEL
jgi:serine phosphatase RsbU (regulator of sigma subunit)